MKKYKKSQLDFTAIADTIIIHISRDENLDQNGFILTYNGKEYEIQEDESLKIVGSKSVQCDNLSASEKIGADKVQKCIDYLTELFEAEL